MSRSRVKIPEKLKHDLFYRSARTCAVCRVPGGVQIHHIDENSSNNNEDNLVVLCLRCHDEAHTKRSLTQNLTSEDLLHAKKKWEAEVAERSARGMTQASNTGLSRAVWTYVNHQRLPAVMKNYGVEFNSDVLSFLEEERVVDRRGIPIFSGLAPEGKAGGYITIYDHFNPGNSMRLHTMYADAVDSLIVRANPIEMGAIWTKKEIKALVEPGRICFCIRGFNFKREKLINGEQNRFVSAKARGIEVKFMANTRHMFGTSAIYSSFVGKQYAAVLFLTKSISFEKTLTVHGTPLAMGTGFASSTYDTPHPLRYGWATGRAQEFEIL